MRRIGLLGLLLLVAGCGSGSPAPAAAPAPAATPAATPATTAPATTAHPTHTPAPTAPLRAGERFTALQVARPYVPKAPSGGSDEYRCFLVDPGLRAPAVLTGNQFRPGNPDIVHHAIVYRVPAADVAEAEALDRAGPGDGWTCFGGTGVGGSGPASRLGTSDWVAAWAPGGADEVRTPPGTGYPLDRGGRLVLQVHYNLLRAPAGTSDRPGVRLRLADPAAGLTPLRTALLPAPVELPCAAGESGSLCDRESSVLDVMSRFGSDAGGVVAGLTLLCSPAGRPRPGPVQSCDHRVRDAGRVYGLAGHMHLLGTRITVQLNPGTPRARTLLDEDPYNFHDQRSVTLPQPVAVRAGDTLRVTCTHDTTQRKHLSELSGVPPRYVVWGDGTTDEMCLGIVVRD
jgi:hypothetical protein